MLQAVKIIVLRTVRVIAALHAGWHVRQHANYMLNKKNEGICMKIINSPETMSLSEKTFREKEPFLLKIRNKNFILDL